MRALGVDVSEKRGLDLVLLDGSLRPRVHGGATLGAAAARASGRWRPDAIAIDSPPAWGVAGGSAPARRRRCGGWASSRTARHRTHRSRRTGSSAG